MSAIRSFTIAGIAFALLLPACELPEKVTGDLTGTITVKESAYWDHVKIGLFYSSEVDTDANHYLVLVDDGEVRRMGYSKDADGSAVQFSPAVSVAIVDNRDSPTVRSYGVDVPPDPIPGRSLVLPRRVVRH